MASVTVLPLPALPVEDRQIDNVPQQMTEPTALAGPMAWHGSQFVDESTYVVHLTEFEVAEIDKAVSSFEGIATSKSIVAVKPLTLADSLD
jgi:hypothetical protein